MAARLENGLSVIAGACGVNVAENDLFISVVVPLFNEVENVAPLVEEVDRVMQAMKTKWEFVCVDDGSTDGTYEQLKRISETEPRMRVISLRRNFGQTAAMLAGMQHASGNIIVTMDGDLQNDPADIAAMLAHIQAGADVVLGWRRHREDALVNRKIPSRIANWLISRMTGVPVHDLGCTLRAMRVEVARELELYGEMHRFIPVLAHHIGSRIVEMETHHRARKFGKTKYGIGRTSRVILDLITVFFLINYLSSPMKLFGKMGLITVALSLGAFAITIGMKTIGGVDMTGNPLLLMGALGTLLGFQFFAIGLLGEVSARVYYSVNGKRNYHIRHKLNFTGTPEEIESREIPIRERQAA